eukprot:COSAG02_NODE_585_length_19988_cov_11.056061_9_plen_164_part_00
MAWGWRPQARRATAPRWLIAPNELRATKYPLSTPHLQTRARRARHRLLRLAGLALASALASIAEALAHRCCCGCLSCVCVCGGGCVVLCDIFSLPADRYRLSRSTIQNETRSNSARTQFHIQMARGRDSAIWFRLFDLSLGGRDRESRCGGWFESVPDESSQY